MARPLRLAVPGGIFHVLARGNAHQAIFIDDEDRRAFIDSAIQVRSRYGWRFLTYCLMSNHYHLVVVTPQPTLSRGMRHLNGVHAQRFNRRHGRVGHVFAGRFKAVLVQADDHLLELARYVALNPVRAQLCARPERWRWSAHLALIGAADDRLIEPRELLSYFGRGIDEARRGYASFVSTLHDPPAECRRAVLGTPQFAAANLPSADCPEIPRKQFLTSEEPLEELLSDGGSGEAIANAYRDHGYQLREIAEHLGCHYATVSRRLRRHEETGH
jgi:putative transposase